MRSMKDSFSSRRLRGLLHLIPFAGRLLVLGHILILLSLCWFAVMLSGEGQAEALLYMETYMGSVGGATAVLWGVVLGVDLLDRTYVDRS